MEAELSTRAIALVDDDQASRAVLDFAHVLSGPVTVLATVDTTLAHNETDVVRSMSADPTMTEVLALAAERGAPWVVMRRSVTSPETLITELIVGAGKAITKDLPGFGVLLVSPREEPYGRVLVVADRTHGSMSGLMMYMATLVAVRAPATLDILVIGGPGEDVTADDSFDALAVNREESLFAAAREMGEREDVTINWIAAGDVADPASLVATQCEENSYDLIIDDIGDIAVSTLRRGTDAAEALQPGAVGAVPYAILAGTETDVLLVLDEIRLGLITNRMVRLGAAAAAALAIVAGGAIAAHSESPEQPSASRVTASSQDTRAELAETNAEVDLAKERADAGTTSSRGGAKKSAKTAKVHAPKGGASSADVAKAERAQAKAKAAYKDAKDAQAKAEAKAAKSNKAFAAAAAEAQRAETEITVAQGKLDDFKRAAVTAHEDGDGLAGLLPKAPSKEEIAAADKAVTDAEAWLAEATARGEQALDELKAAQKKDPKTDKALAAASKETAEARAKYDAAKVKADVYRESFGRTRQLPVKKGHFHYTARYGDSGSAWSKGYHTGLDFAASTGTNVHAAASGKVVEAGYDGAYGNRIVIDVGDGYFNTYNHLSNIDVRVGEHVTTGDKIGDVGNTGNSFGSHLHFEVTKGGDGWKSGSFVNPADWLGI